MRMCNENSVIIHVIYDRYMPALTNGDFAVYTNIKGTTIAVSYSDCVCNLHSTYTQAILKMTQVLVLNYTSIYT